MTDSDSDTPAEPSRRPKRGATKPAFIESGSSDEEIKDAALRKPKSKKKARAADQSIDSVDDLAVSGMNELERELVVYERVEANEMRKQREEIRLKLMNDHAGPSKTRKKGQKPSKPVHEEASEEGERFSTSSESEGEIRSKAGGNKEEPEKEEEEEEHDNLDVDYHKPSEIQAKVIKKNAMKELLLKRKDKKDQEEKKKESEKGRAVLDIDEIFGGVGGDKSSSSSSSSSRSSSRSSSLSRSSRSRSASPETVKEIESLEELEKARLSRFRLAQFVHRPIFKDLVIGCFVRVGIGRNGANDVYRIAEITDVVETAKVYEVEKTRTNKGLKLKLGGATKVFRLEFVSNQHFKNSEYVHWLEHMRNANLTLPSVDFVQGKRKMIEEASNKEFTNAEIEFMVTEKQRFKKAPTNFAVVKSRLMKDKANAEASGDLQRLREVQHEIDELDLTAGELERKRNEQLSIVTLINQKRRNEMKRNFLDSDKMRDETERQDDPFTRKSNRTKVVSGVPKKNRELMKAQAAAAEAAKLQEATSSQSQINLPADDPAAAAAADLIKPKIQLRPAYNGKVPAWQQPKQISAHLAKHMEIDIDLDLDI